jgi:hypothetical protein
MVCMKRRHDGTKAGLGHRFALRTIRFQRGILRVDLGLCLFEGGPWFEAGDQMLEISTGMPLLGSTIFEA